MNKWYSQTVKSEWDFDRCIICQKKPVPPNKMSEEHVIPAALSGILRVDFLCKTCNDHLGSDVDCTACSDIEIRRAANALVDMPLERLKDINIKLNERQRVIIRQDGQRDIEGIISGEDILPVTRINDEGRLMRSNELMLKDLRKFMLKHGKSEQEFDEAKAKFNAAPAGQDIEPTPGFVTKKYAIVNPTIHAMGSQVRSLLLLKIAFEFLAMIIGDKIYHPSPALDKIREYLEKLDKEYPFVVPFALPDKYHVHGIAVEQSKPSLSIQFRLFGSMAYLVSFPGYTIDIHRWAYTHDLALNKDTTVDRDLEYPPKSMRHVFSVQ